MTNTHDLAGGMATTATDSRLDWLLTDLVKRVHQTRHAIVLSEDGLLMSRSETIPRDDAEQLAAAAAGLQSLARSIGRGFAGGSVRQTLVEMDDAFLFLTAAGTGAHLAVLAEQSADVGVVAFEMNMLVKKVGEYLGTRPRGDEGGTRTGGRA
ncbi:MULTISPECIES: roadblock/LC7 domain-containing protein [Embleya]|uniref:Dynein regulation protein LC7 n=2 Tax=Embleya TaxID=2699295 RepID=A0A1T3NT08_9ACTN|nr:MULTISPECIES: roadblock/LC7 domain-containing protein [Embleya]OPC80033.1 dynein regulation protein LC7 [Embleya scabrispora]GCE01385.1 dynein regulation protein LC7 [Embleya hyalina]